MQMNRTGPRTGAETIRLKEQRKAKGLSTINTHTVTQPPSNGEGESMCTVASVTPCLAQLRQSGSPVEKAMGEERGWEEATDCQIAAWQSSVPSGTVTTSATAASVVVAVR